MNSLRKFESQWLVFCVSQGLLVTALCFSLPVGAFSEGPPEETLVISSKATNISRATAATPKKGDFRKHIQSLAKTVNRIQSSKQLYKMLAPDLSAKEKKSIRRKLRRIKGLPRATELGKNGFLLSFNGVKYRVTVVDPEEGKFLVNGRAWVLNPEKSMLQQFYALDKILKAK